LKTGEPVAGNQVGIKIGETQYAFFAHLQPGSIRLRVGDRVRRGQMITLVGNAGNSVGPHLHFHVCDQNSLNGCEGLPFVFDAFEMVGHWPENYKPKPSKFAEEIHRLELPLKDRVVRFTESSNRSNKRQVFKNKLKRWLNIRHR
jgi:murein DD-endopeptidase MepM/ murein hydrolase activator NlpD